MAQPYLAQLEGLVKQHAMNELSLECKHFFSGAALYARGNICASLTPIGLAFKLPPDVCTELIDRGAATHLQYFAKSPIKKGYVLFPDMEEVGNDDLARYFELAVSTVRPGTP